MANDKMMSQMHGKDGFIAAIAYWLGDLITVPTG
jgi:hypothetical protein